MNTLKNSRVIFTFIVLLAAGNLYAQGNSENHGEQPSQFAQIPRGVPIVMLNMLKFSPKAHYDTQNNSLTGREAYDEYRKGASKLVAKTGGKRLWIGNVKLALIAPKDEQWDEVFLVQYPSIEAFLKMINSPEYKAVAIHRTAALDDSRLIAMIEER